MDIVDTHEPLMAKNASGSIKKNSISNKDKPTYKAYTVSTDIALRLCGNAHKYQMKTMLIMSLQCLVAAFINMGFPYLFRTPEVACYPSDSSPESAVPCTVKEACVPGVSHIYLKTSGRSLTEEFDLACEEDSFEAACGALLLLGGCIGSVIYADTTESVGRLRVIKETGWLMAISMVVSSFSINVYMFCGCMIFFGAAYRAYFNACIIYLTETTSDNIRQLAPNVLSIGWAFGQIIIALLAIINEDWQFITLVYTAMPIIIFLTFTRFIVESPRYLVAKKRFTEAKQSLQAISFINSRPLPEDFHLQEEQQQRTFKDNLDKILGIQEGSSNTKGGIDPYIDGEKGKTHSFRALFEYKSLRIRTVIITYVWCLLSFSYFVSAFAVEHLSGNMHYNLMGMGLGELIAYLYSGYISLKFPRKTIFRGILWVGGLIHLAFFAFLYVDESFIMFKVASFASIIALRLAISCGNCIFNVYIAEVYPTTVRHYAFGYFGLVTKLIAIFAPPFVSACKVFGFSPFIPLSVFFFAGIPALSKLRETFGHALRDQLEEEETTLLQTELPLLPMMKHLPGNTNAMNSNNNNNNNNFTSYH